MKFRIVIPGAPRTKKTSNRILGFGGTCDLCGRPKFSKVQPSEAHEKWFRMALSYSPILRGKLGVAGLELPIRTPVSVAAQFYRDADRGDTGGYYQALADFLQEPRIFRSRTTGAIIRRREGGGFIADDSLIRDWDGSRLLVDRERPRIEVLITVIEEGQCELQFQE